MDTEEKETPIINLDALEKQGDIAADYLEELLDIADIDGDLDIEVRNSRPYVSILNEGEETHSLKVLVGKNNEVLDALQELARLAVLVQSGERTRLILDIDNRRKERLKVLEKIAHTAIEKVKETQHEVHLEAMSSFERKLIHDRIAHAELISESEGQGRSRHIVVKPHTPQSLVDQEEIPPVK